MSVSQQVPKDAPVIKAWEAHKATEEYTDSLKWAAHPEAVEGSLWALFYAGYFACAVHASAELADERMEHDLLKELLSRPEIDDFQDGLVLEAAHQRKRWGDAHDRDKSSENWFWLVGYLAGKALRAAIEGNQNKARHHTISAAAALFQWWKVIPSAPNGIGKDADLTPAEAPKP